MKFSIITPSLNQLDCLKKCVASVADQQGVEVEHRIVDGGSTDGTVEWLTETVANQSSTAHYQLTFSSEGDEGMYDALNKGFDWASGELFAWLNCDEQYLPNALQTINARFANNTPADIIFGGMLVVDSRGKLLACRKAMPMRRRFLEASYLYNYSCAMFIRSTFWEKLGGFNTGYQNAGDEELVRRALSVGAKTVVLSQYLSAFGYSNRNLSSSPEALEEHERLNNNSSVISRIFKLPINFLRLTEKALRDGHAQREPVAYEIYVDGVHGRVQFDVAHSTCKWPDEKMPYLLSHRLK